MGQIDSVRAVRDTCMALAWDGVRSLRVNADVEDLLALVPAGQAGRGHGWPLQVAFAEATNAADQPGALHSAWSQVVMPTTRKALLLRVHAPGDFNPQSAVWAAWRAGLQPHCRVSYWDVWDPQLAAGHKRFVVWVGAWQIERRPDLPVADQVSVDVFVQQAGRQRLVGDAFFHRTRLQAFQVAT
ncbi:hypothetical protein [Limnohabitans sp.]|uniref:hypothetical protein n=1 Tax=Limnohabitans sp. TaxID=1907725 RepID=UPI0031FDE669